MSNIYETLLSYDRTKVSAERCRKQLELVASLTAKHGVLIVEALYIELRNPMVVTQ